MKKKGKLGFCLKITKDCLGKAKATGDGKILLKFATDYFNDALYYENKDSETALEAVAYAHGFIDAGVLLGLIKIPKYHLQKAK